MMPRFSVIVPCYNAGNYITKCLDSLAAQVYRDFDVIMVDDCSTDDTEERVQNYCRHSELAVTYTKNEKNSGPAASRNRGIGLSSSEYIVFCDSDDWYEPDLLQLVAQEADESSADLIFYGYYTVMRDKDGEKKMPHFLSNTEQKLNAHAALKLPVDSLGALAVRREIAASVPAPDIRNGEDMAIIPLMMVAAKRFGIVNRCLYNYLYRQNSASNSANGRIVDSLVLSFDHIQSHLPAEYRAECEYLGIRNLLYGAMLNLFKFSFDTKRARRILTDFEAEYPDWSHNFAMCELPLYKKVFLSFVRSRFFIGVKLLSCLHSILTKGE